jgi:hypothetical protein
VALAAVLMLLLAQEPTPVFDLYTFGPGDDLFSHFGHSAICLTDAGHPNGACFNYGTADFSTPVPLTIAFIQGKALFWVSLIDRARMLAYYRDEDRTVFRQRLPLTETEARELRDRLIASASGNEKFYRYHHYRDNCTTRIRDLLDRTLGGRIATRTSSTPPGPSFRELTRRGFAGNVPLLIVTALVLGRPADQATSAWEAMFLPASFMSAVAEALRTPPVVEYQRHEPLPHGSESAGDWALVGIGAALALALWLSRGHRAVLVTVALSLGIVALALDVLASMSSFPELSRNEVLLVLVPTDLLLIGAPRAFLSRRYAPARLLGLGAVALLVLSGALVQPLLPVLALAGLPMIALWRRPELQK